MLFKSVRRKPCMIWRCLTYAKVTVAGQPSLQSFVGQNCTVVRIVNFL